MIVKKFKMSESETEIDYINREFNKQKQKQNKLNKQFEIHSENTIKRMQPMKSNSKSNRSKPTSFVQKATLEKLNRYLVEDWRERIVSDQIEGRNVMKLFKLNELSNLKLWDIKQHLGMLPQDVYKELKHERRRVGKHAARNIRNVREKENEDQLKEYIECLEMQRESLRSEKAEMLSEIQYYRSVNINGENLYQFGSHTGINFSAGTHFQPNYVHPSDNLTAYRFI